MNMEVSKDGWTMAREEHPYIIWTLQRTGGTNLAKRLTALSRFAAVQHEPFNNGRIYGHVAEAWQCDQDSAALQASVNSICERKVLIKHCVEEVAWAVTEALIEASCRAGYRHIFLYRRQPLDRLLSLHFARKTGVWGAQLKGQTLAARAQVSAGPMDSALEEPLPIAQLVAHEGRCVNVLGRTLKALCDRGQEPAALAYEDVYRAEDPEQPYELVTALLRYLALSRGAEADRAFVASLITEGDQGTRSKYRQFKGVEDLEERLAGVRAFALERGRSYELSVQPCTHAHPWLLRLAIDPLPPVVAAGERVTLGGILVLRNGTPAGLQLSLSAGGMELPVEWQIPSPWAAKQFPSGTNAANARFRFRDFDPTTEGGSWRLLLARPPGEVLPLAEILVSRSLRMDCARTTSA